MLAASGSGFSVGDYDNDNSNSNVSAHIGKQDLGDADHASTAKNKYSMIGHWYLREDDLNHLGL